MIDWLMSGVVDRRVFFVKGKFLVIGESRGGWIVGWSRLRPNHHEKNRVMVRGPNSGVSPILHDRQPEGQPLPLTRTLN